MENFKKDIRIKIHSELYEVDASLFSNDDVDTDNMPLSVEDPEPQILDINSLGTFTDDGERISISYDESEATGMEGSFTSISFLKSEPSVISMTRTGIVSATLVFEEGKRYHCIYKTPFMPFEICTRTVKVENLILAAGTLTLDYIVEIRGAKAERTKFSCKILG